MCLRRCHVDFMTTGTQTNHVYLSLGSNQGNKRRNMITALALLAERAGDIPTLSAFYETEPWGFDSDHTFLNAVAYLQTTLSPTDLLVLTQQIECELGRTVKSENRIYHDRRGSAGTPPSGIASHGRRAASRPVTQSRHDRRYRFSCIPFGYFTL